MINGIPKKDLHMEGITKLQEQADIKIDQGGVKTLPTPSVQAAENSDIANVVLEPPKYNAQQSLDILSNNGKVECCAPSLVATMMELAILLDKNSKFHTENKVNKLSDLISKLQKENTQLLKQAQKVFDLGVGLAVVGIVVNVLAITGSLSSLLSSSAKAANAAGTAVSANVQKANALLAKINGSLNVVNFAKGSNITLNVVKIIVALAGLFKISKINNSYEIKDDEKAVKLAETMLKEQKKREKRTAEIIDQIMLIQRTAQKNMHENRVKMMG